MIRKFVTAAAVSLMALAGAANAQSNPLAKDVFGNIPRPNQGPSEAIGGYSKGCASGNVALPESGPTWQAMRLSRNRYWAQPETVEFLIGLSRAATKVGWRGIYIGDLTQPRGGPMLSGHASHQSGLDADVWMLPPSRLNLSQSERESISSVSVVNSAGTALTNHWTPGHARIIQAAAMDDRVDRIFVDPVVKVVMCQSADRGDTKWLQKIRPLNNHNYHFHIRLKCPRGDRNCEPQTPSVAQLSNGGSGCDQAVEWVQNRINPPKRQPSTGNSNYRHPRTYRISELPSQCVGVANSQ